MKRTKTSNMALCALFAAMSAVLSQIMLPIGPVPITLTHISVFMAGALLGSKLGALSQIAFVMLGAFGLPVFAGMKGGIGVVFGPTGGFIAGYIFCAFITGLIIELLGRSFPVIVSAMLAGIFVTYALGLPWYMFLTKSEFNAAFAVCVLPFLPGDFLKITLCTVLAKRLGPVLQSGGA